MTLVDFHVITFHVKGHIGHMKEVVGKILLDDVTFVAATYDELIDVMMAVEFHDMPEDWLAANLNHRFGLKDRLFANPRAKATSQQYSFQASILIETKFICYGMSNLVGWE